MARQGPEGITWTDETWNPVRGCTRVSQGCVNCYAEGIAARFSNAGQPYEGLATRNPSRWTGEVRFIEGALTIPLKWKRPRRIFVNSMSDLFHENLPFPTIDRIFAVMALAPRHTFQVLTKRPQRMLEYMTETRGHVVLGRAWEMLGHHPLNRYNHGGIQTRPWPLPNVWLGVSVENQETADERIPLLLKIPAAKRFLSCEPLLGPVTFRWAKWHDYPTQIAQRRETSASLLAGEYDGLKGIDWVIVGGESGKGARMMQEDWALSLLHQCRENGTAFFMKQMTAKAPIPPAMLVREFPRGHHDALL